MQDLSYSFSTAPLALMGLRLSVMIYTFENAYGLDPSRTALREENGVAWALADGLVWAGGQEKAAGRVSVSAWRQDGRVRVRVSAEGLSRAVRSVKLTVHDIKPGRVLNKLDLLRPEITRRGLLLSYPEGWRTLDTPMVVIGHPDGDMTCLRSLGTRVRDTRFALIRRSDTVDCELISEQYASDIDTRMDAPDFEIGPVASLEEAYARQTAHIRDSYGLVPWEERQDVPEWAREVSLVASIHCQHWTGYVFNDYARVLKTLEALARQIEPRRILAFLPGWEGRYYWQYGDFRPDSRMGGEGGFKRLCDGAAEMGAHLMPMVGVNVVNRDIEGFEQWGVPSLAMNVTGGIGCGSVDWDGSRHYQHGSNAALNPGAVQWQRRLSGQIEKLAERYGIPAVFLDIAACWYNDPHFQPTNEGVKAMCDLIRARAPGMLVAGEAWYDGLAPAMPVVHSGHTDGPMHYHDALYAPFFDTWMREFSHLCLGDPSRGSTGAHELGENQVEWRAPLRRGIWQTLTIVDGTLEAAPERVAAIVSDAREYARRYIVKA